MNKISLIITLWILFVKGTIMAFDIGEKYINWLNIFFKDIYTHETEVLFNSNVQKIVNSRIIARNRNEIIPQMRDIAQNPGVEKFDVLEHIKVNNKFSVIRWEFTYKDGEVESVITFVRGNDEGHITEINEVFGLKGIYEFKPIN